VISVTLMSRLLDTVGDDEAHPLAELLGVVADLVLAMRRDTLSFLRGSYARCFDF
jgi:hypothetical protein